MSKELEVLEQLKYYNTIANDDFDMTNELSIIETALKEYEGAKKHIEALNKERIENSIKLKALEIIKKIIKYDIEVNGNNTIPEYYQNDVLTQEEFELLKEVLLW